MRRMMAVGLASALLILAGCSASEKVEDEVKEAIEKQTPDTKDVKVDCPDDMKAKKGQKFDCDVEANVSGETIKGIAHIDFTSDNQFNVEVEPADAGESS